MSTSAIPRRATRDPDIKFEYRRTASNNLEVITVPTPGSQSQPYPQAQPQPQPQQPQVQPHHHSHSHPHSHSPANGRNQTLRPERYADLITSSSTSQSQILALIKASASQNSSLLVTLRETADAPQALAVKNVEIEKLKDELETQEKVLKELEVTIVKLRSGKLGDGTLKVLLKRAGALLTRLGRRKKSDDRIQADRAGNDEGVEEGDGKQTQIDEQQKMYFEALAMKSKEEKRREELIRQRSLLEDQAKALEPQAELHDKTHAELDGLYASIFEGPTPGFPEEDAAEAAYGAAQQRFSGSKNLVVTRRKGIRFTERVAKSLKLASVHVDDAKIEVQNAVFLGLANVKWDLANLEHYLTIAMVDIEKATESLASEDRNIGNLSRKMQASLRSARIDPAAKLERAALLSRLESATVALTTGTSLLEQLVAAAKQEEVAARGIVRETARALDDARSGLQQIRQEAFEQVAGYGAAPPAYHNCCSRADQYEGECDLVVERSPVDEDVEIEAFSRAEIVNESDAQQ